MSAPPSRPFLNAPADTLHQPAYAALAVWTRELLFLEMWAGQMLCEAFNWVLKHIIKEDRPNGELVPVYGSLLDYAPLGIPSETGEIGADEHSAESMGPGYGFPSSHSQWMGYFAAFLLCHFTFRHRFVSTGFRVLDGARTLVLYTGIISWSAAVAYSRCVYHFGRSPACLAEVRAQLSPDISLCTAGAVGSRHRCRFRRRVLCSG